MGDMNATQKAQQKAQNLARIRDNQRRSRARRKEYLQELEAKLRACEQTGIKASAEIQSAARKVLDENKKLRTLLQERGVSEGDIVATLGGTLEQSYGQISCAPSLTTMLERKIPCENLSSHISSRIRSNARSVTPNSFPPNSMASGRIGTPLLDYASEPFYTTPTNPPVPKTEDIPFIHFYGQNPWTYTGEVDLTNPGFRKPNSLA